MDMRPVERIDIFWKLFKSKTEELSVLLSEKIGVPNAISKDDLDTFFGDRKKLKYWKSNPDLRFVQLLPNVPGFWYYMEDNELADELGIPRKEYQLWGTYGKSGKEKLQYKLASELETGHIEAVLNTQHHLTPNLRSLFQEILEERRSRDG